MAPSFASLYCGFFEHQCVLNQLCNPCLPCITNWRRYIDDVFFIWKGSETELKEFHDFMNKNNYNLKFTMEYEEQQMNFLDILVFKDSNKLCSNLYRKSTHRNFILHGQSFHPIPLKKSLPISQFNRIRHICSSNSDFEAQSADLVKRFQQRQYRQKWIAQASSRFENVTQSECLYRTRSRVPESKVNCIQYSPLGREFQSIIHKHWHIIESDPALRCFSAPPRIVYKRPPNLRNMLVRAHLPSLTQPHFLQTVTHGNYKCGNCSQCNFTHKTSTFHHPRTGKSYNIKVIITCNSINIIYMLRCPCGLAYVG